MYQGLAESLGELAWFLQSVSQTIPVSQVSLLAWLMYVISCSLTNQSPFKAPEQRHPSLSKASFQKPNALNLVR